MSSAWNAANYPNTTSENAIIQAASLRVIPKESVSIGCMDIQSGGITCEPSFVITITGDYFRNLTAGGIAGVKCTGETTFKFDMGGSAAQTFENVDTFDNLRISSNSTVTFTRAFTLTDQLSLTGTTTTLKIQADLTLSSTTRVLTIPAGVTVEVSQGATFTVLGGITVNGTLLIKAGSKVVLGNATTLSVSSTGMVQITGASGNVAQLQANGTGTFTFTLNGLLSAEYFRIARMAATGINAASATSQIQNLNNGEFHYIANSGYAITIANNSVTFPAAMDNVGFYANGNSPTGNINAATYSGALSSSLGNWSGDRGGESYDNDPNNKFSWGAEAATKLALADKTPASRPPSSIGPSSADTHFATFGFSLTKTDTATNITQVTLTMDGTASAGDVSTVKVYRDGNANCAWNGAATDPQIGGNLTLSGSPPKATVSIPSGNVQTSGATPGCIHVLASTSAIAEAGKTISFQIALTSEVTNSAGYAFSDTSGPPVGAGSSTITGGTTATWIGMNSTAWTVKENWDPQLTPSTSSTVNCVVGAATRVANVDANVACMSATLQSGGTTNYSSTTNRIDVYGHLRVQSGYTFQNAASGQLRMIGAVNQNMSLETSFPGNFEVANTGPSASETVTMDQDSSISGNLTLSNGTLKVAPPFTLTVGGNITVQTGATLEIEPGATLKIGNGRTLTVDVGGKLKMLGSASTRSVMTSSSGSYGVVVNGTIEARYYTFDNLGTNGVSIEAGAAIDATSHLQDCTLRFVSTIGNNSRPRPEIGGNFQRISRREHRVVIATPLDRQVEDRAV